MTKVDKPTQIVSDMLSNLGKFRDLQGGSEAMRKAGNAYLVRGEEESDKAYDNRLKLAFLFNGLMETVADMNGRVMDQPVTLKEGASQDAIDWAENIDMAGRNLANFASDVLTDGLVSGINFLLVDAPMRQGGETVQQARDRNLRPFVKHLRVLCRFELTARSAVRRIMNHPQS